MGPFFYSKKEIPANAKHFVSLSFFKFFLETPPKATVSLSVKFLRSLNLFIPKKFLFFLNKEDINIFSTF